MHKQPNNTLSKPITIKISPRPNLSTSRRAFTTSFPTTSTSSPSISRQRRSKIITNHQRLVFRQYHHHHHPRQSRQLGPLLSSSSSQLSTTTTKPTRLIPQRSFHSTLSPATPSTTTTTTSSLSPQLRHHPYQQQHRHLTTTTTTHPHNKHKPLKPRIHHQQRRYFEDENPGGGIPGGGDGGAPNTIQHTSSSGRELYIHNTETSSKAEFYWSYFEKIKANQGDIIGIKLGPSNMCMSYIEKSIPVAISHRDGSVQTPAAISINVDGTVLFGKQALEEQLLNPHGVIYDFMKFLGRPYEDPQTIKDQQLVPYDLIPIDRDLLLTGDGTVDFKTVDKGMVGFNIWDDAYTLEDIIRLFMAPMRYIINRNVARETNRVILTVPPNLQQHQMDKLAVYFRNMDMVVYDIIAEPLAVACAYGWFRPAGYKIAVWDIGGTAFDFTLIECDDDGLPMIKTTKGTPFIGGVDFDTIISDHIIDQCQKELGIDLRREEITFERVKTLAKETKEKLSTEKYVDIDLPFIHADQLGPKHFNMRITQEEYHELATPILWRLFPFVNQAFQESEWKVQDVDEVLLAGGMCKWPLVKQLVTQYFTPFENAVDIGDSDSSNDNKKNTQKATKPKDNHAANTINKKIISIKDHVPPDEAAAHGAARYGIIQRSGGGINNVNRFDPHSKQLNPITLGFAVNGSGEMTRMINFQRVLPAKVSQTIRPKFWNMRELSIDVYQGESLLTKYNKFIGSLVLRLPHALPPGAQKFGVGFEVDKRGLLKVLAYDYETGETATDTFGSVHAHGMTNEEIVRQQQFAQFRFENERSELKALQLYDKAQITYWHVRTEYEKMKHAMTAEHSAEFLESLDRLHHVIQNPQEYTQTKIGEITDKVYRTFWKVEDIWHRNTNSSKLHRHALKTLTKHPYAEHVTNPQRNPHFVPSYEWFSAFTQLPLMEGLSPSQKRFLDKLYKTGEFGEDRYKKALDFRFKFPEKIEWLDEQYWSPISWQFINKNDRPWYYDLNNKPLPADKGQFHPDLKKHLPQTEQDKLDKEIEHHLRLMRRYDAKVARRQELIDSGQFEPEQLPEIEKPDIPNIYFSENSDDLEQNDPELQQFLKGRDKRDPQVRQARMMRHMQLKEQKERMDREAKVKKAFTATGRRRWRPAKGRRPETDENAKKAEEIRANLKKKGHKFEYDDTDSEPLGDDYYYDEEGMIRRKIHPQEDIGEVVEVEPDKKDGGDRKDKKDGKSPK